jgi:acyl-CoA reductase-like NAD-dependent aldehyde dehydrogenase
MLYESIEVVGQIVPWNFQMLMFFTKASPALACRCEMAIKYAWKIPLTTLYCAQFVHKVLLFSSVSLEICMIAFA